MLLIVCRPWASPSLMWHCGRRVGDRSQGAEEGERRAEE